MNYRKWGSGDPRAVDRVMHGCICDADVAMLHGALELPKYGQEVFSVKSRMVQHTIVFIQLSVELGLL